MDNASKALIIAGEILITIMILSVAAWVIATFGKFSADTNAKLAEDKRAKFNNNFYDMNGRINITADEIASILNFAKENNDNYELDFTNNNAKSIYFVNVNIDGESFFKFYNKYITNVIGYNKSSISKAEFKDVINNFLNNNNNNYFSCNAKINQKGTYIDSTGIRNISYSLDDQSGIIENDKTGLVCEISFKSTKSLMQGSPLLNGGTSMGDDGYTVINKEKYKLNLT